MAQACRRPPRESLAAFDCVIARECKLQCAKPHGRAYRCWRLGSRQGEVVLAGSCAFIHALSKARSCWEGKRRWLKARVGPAAMRTRPCSRSATAHAPSAHAAVHWESGNDRHDYLTWLHETCWACCGGPCKAPWAGGGGSQGAVKGRAGVPVMATISTATLLTNVKAAHAWTGQGGQ